MKFHALLVSSDSTAKAVLSPVLSGFGLAVECCTHSEAEPSLARRRFDAVVVDFDEESAAETLQSVEKAAQRKPVTVALLSDNARVRSVFGAGANFVLYKPISAEQAQASLRAATALIKRERRRALRVPIQVPVRLRVRKGPEVEGILLDLSEDGMEVLAAKPLCPGAVVEAQFSLPQGDVAFRGKSEVVWANPNGQSGMRHTELSGSVRSALQNWVAERAGTLPAEDLDSVTACKLTDLSLGACYVETQSPFPECSSVVLRLKAEGIETQARGMVRVMHPGCGMGIEFASSTAQERNQVRQFIEFLTSRPGVTPELAVSPDALCPRQGAASQSPGAGEFDDPLLELLRKPDSLSQEEFLQQLREQRGASAGV
jgi:CheY-like chemotaxis protein